MLTQIRAEKPIIHCLTNHVVSNFQANGLLSLGASPIMGEAPEEAADLAALAGAVSLNIGTLNETTVTSMLIAGKAANKKGVPVILDPVGAGATPYRLSTVKRILEEVEVSVLRCNAGELAAIMGADWQSKGVDAGAGEADITQLARSSAKKLSVIVAVTGKTDVVTDGDTVIENASGDPIMTSVTGMGCLLSAVVAAFSAVSPDRPLAAAAEALRFYGLAGEKAAQHVKGPGSFQTAFLDALSSVRQSDIDELNRMEDGAL
ncbi:hydroxyethylthiazole kinase [Planococcus lenghuensis]|uniref:Hydroxyethylthiazole kinase n=1 Tax=Planococcus lenghuensis TaxID=2213202 RepID=A0A1Q2KYA1_9BACL|nr:hydroxyethylthiazole kinase [Planococcus lenghuensis]AQQ53084.1 hydroxyethylthiazole kinase [Planococcus lenghuensis]